VIRGADIAGAITRISGVCNAIGGKAQGMIEANGERTTNAFDPQRIDSASRSPENDPARRDLIHGG
jgi:hypothetical protein